jgi:DNA-binding NarL/FixJ family response regulator
MRGVLASGCERSPGWRLVRGRTGTLEDAAPTNFGADAALIDVTMPDGNGLELVGEINDGGVGSPIPTMVLTASLNTSVAGRAIEQGAWGALSKMASMPETVDSIKRLTDARGS